MDFSGPTTCQLTRCMSTFILSCDFTVSFNDLRVEHNAPAVH